MPVTWMRRNPASETGWIAGTENGLMDRRQLADFLRARRAALRPEDVGLTAGPRRRTPGLRREEVAALSGISADDYSRIEQQRGHTPSEQVLASIARGMHLTLDERDHLLRLAGHAVRGRVERSDHVNSGLMRVLDRLHDTPAQVVNTLGETLIQTRLAVALLGDETSFSGPSRSRVYRWFTDPDARRATPPRATNIIPVRSSPDCPTRSLSTVPVRGRVRWPRCCRGRAQSSEPSGTTTPSPVPTVSPSAFCTLSSA